MENTQKQAMLDKLLNAYSHQYDIDRDVNVEGTTFPATATFFLRDENYLVSKKHVLSAVENYDYTYFYITEHLDAETLRSQIELTKKAGTARIKPSRDHMSSFISLIILADTIDDEAKKLIKKTRFQKYFRLALHSFGWHSTAGWSIT